MNQTGKSLVKMEICAKIIRADGSEEDLGTIQYWHKNPVKRLMFQANTTLKGGLSWLRKL